MNSPKVLLCGVLIVLVTMPSVLAFGIDNPCSKTSPSGWSDKNLCGHGDMFAIIVTSDDPNLESDLNSYDSNSGLPACTTTNKCLEVAKPYGIPNPSPTTKFDVSFYVELAHKTAPGAKILVVEAKSIGWQDKWDAENWAKSRPEVEKQVSVSWSKLVIELGLVLKQK